MKVDISNFDYKPIENPVVKKPILVLTEKDPSSLSRQLVTSDGVVLCQCDGTSAQVRNCLRDSDPRFLGINNHQINDDRFSEQEQYHLSLTYICASEGFTKLAYLTKPESRL